MFQTVLPKQKRKYTYKNNTEAILYLYVVELERNEELRTGKTKPGDNKELVTIYTRMQYLIYEIFYLKT